PDLLHLVRKRPLSGLNFWSVVIFQRCFERFLLRSQLVAGQHNLQLLFDCWPVIKERTDLVTRNPAICPSVGAEDTGL
ncbi:hypothetical protein, partial [Salmonella enterica]|uniref:hypothetical protein n=1 Tax=Salmonella enterica TaxID=28901 RepID=UPI001C37A9DA